MGAREGRDRVDLEVSPPLLDAMQSPPREPERADLVPAGVGEPAVIEEVEHPARSRVRVSKHCWRSAIRPSRHRATTALRPFPPTYREALRPAVD